jgi:hypothetical protein
MSVEKNSLPPFCIPTAPWFLYDLGVLLHLGLGCFSGAGWLTFCAIGQGTLCVCERSWSRDAYWRRVFTSFAFNFPHAVTPFQIYIVYQRWLW